jgi:pyruvate dehydrogenase E2 component (dihydrolipoamide acetyltransferase)
MPKLGNTVESCVLVKWNFSEGDEVSADSVLCEIETDKATMDVPSGYSGTLLKRLHAEGDDVPVMEAIAVIGAAGEVWKAEAGAEGPAAAPGAQASDMAESAKATSGPSFAQVSRGASPRAKTLAAKEAIELSVLPGSGPGGRILERDVEAAFASRSPLTAAAKAALSSAPGLSPSPEAGSPLSGSAFGGRANLEDIEKLKALKKAASTSLGAGAVFSETPLKSIRKIIAERMKYSLDTTAQLTLTTSVPAERMLKLRARFKSSDPALGVSGVTIGDLVLFGVSRVLPRYSNLNATLKDNVLRSYSRVDLGLAVDTPRGLMVPVIKSADTLSLVQISKEAKRLAAACIEGKASPDELSGSTFTVTNLGAFGIESFTPILNTPETGILGVCSIVPRPVQKSEGDIGIEMRMGLSLTTDHQVVDGADGARFLQDLSALLADIDVAAML